MYLDYMPVDILGGLGEIKSGVKYRAAVGLLAVGFMVAGCGGGSGVIVPERCWNEAYDN